MTNEELAYLNRIRTQSRGITAFRTTAYFKKKERPSCDRKQLDLDTFCKMPCVCDLSTGVEEMTDHLRLLDVPVSDYFMKLVGWEQLATQGVPRWQVHKRVAGGSQRRGSVASPV